MTPRDRRLGSLLGLAAGDALGATTEFTQPDPRFAGLRSGPHQEIIGGGPFDLVPGAVTDDTQMACCLARSLRRRGGYDVGDAAAEYRAWLGARPPDAGRQVTRSIHAIVGGTPPTISGVRTWEEGGCRAAGNGALMRVAPIAVFYAGDAQARRIAAGRDALITHGDPRCVLANIAYVDAVAAALQGADVASILQAAIDGAGWGQAWLAPLMLPHGPAIRLAAEAVREDVGRAKQAEPWMGEDARIVVDPAGSGFVRVAFTLACWELVHAPDWRSAVIDLANRGGDADTNAAIAGALLGARHGVAAIPEAWIRLLLAAKPDAPWDTWCHPRELVDFARRPRRAWWRWW